MLGRGSFWVGIAVGLAAPMVYHYFFGNLPSKNGN